MLNMATIFVGDSNPGGIATELKLFRSNAFGEPAFGRCITDLIFVAAGYQSYGGIEIKPAIQRPLLWKKVRNKF